MNNILLVNKYFNTDWRKSFNSDNFFNVIEFNNRHENSDNQDKILSKFIINKICEKKDINSITLPISLTENPLNLTGLIFGHHIRLDEDEQIRYLPLIYYSPINFEILLKLDPLSNILVTPNVFFVDLKKYNFQKIKISIENFLQKKKTFDYSVFLDRIDIKPPVDYQSHHNLDNELALFHWSKYIGCDDEISEIKEKLKYNLYIKYYQEKNKEYLKISSNEEFGNLPKFKEINENTKILLIDDDAKKGWGTFFEHLFNAHSIEFASLDTSKIEKREEIIESSIKKVEEFDPDVVILDLRLSKKEDYVPESYTNPKILTGFKILEAIKNKNKGIQVIIFTASDKVWNYRELINQGADDYFIKKVDDKIKNQIENLIKCINNSIKRASFLKNVFTIIEKIKEFIINHDYFNDHEKNEIIYDLDFSFELISMYNKNNNYLEYGFLQLYKCIEKFTDNSNIISYDSNEIKVNKETITIAKKNDEKKWESEIVYEKGIYIKKKGLIEDKYIKDTHFKVSAVLLFLFLDDDISEEENIKSKWSNINKIRNDRAHGNYKKIYKNNKKVTEKHILNILDFIEFLFNVRNIKTTKS
ncbi:MAG: hypothetical protein KatS3mg027_2343 [Bacteroidia bacterium]|nr:MAG: hypothetical protein KatS3mg027_2343 [Bacteroidia bacterium]